MPVSLHWRLAFGGKVASRNFGIESDSGASFLTGIRLREGRSEKSRAKIQAVRQSEHQRNGQAEATEYDNGFESFDVNLDS
jgi:hypothetical protein